ncbi:7814_t:CDS:2, partial [Entrophospora sp. SA101]
STRLNIETENFDIDIAAFQWSADDKNFPGTTDAIMAGRHSISTRIPEHHIRIVLS